MKKSTKILITHLPKCVINIKLVLKNLQNEYRVRIIHNLTVQGIENVLIQRVAHD